MAESSSDLETPLLTSTIHPPDPTTSGQDDSGESNEPRHGWKVRASTREPLSSGRWKFKYNTFLDVFVEADDHTAGKREYYRKQRETLAGFQEVDSISGLQIPSTAEDSSPEDDSGVNIAINVSNYLNIFLLIIKIIASVKSGSLAVVASTLDSLLDLLAGFVLWFAHLYMQKKNHYKFPIGKLHIQPVGIVVFAATMATLGVQVLITGVEQLMEGGKEKMTAGQQLWLIIIMVSATAIKLVLFLYCQTVDDAIVNMYAMDHFFDVVTTALGLAAALLAHYFYWWIDPVGAIFLAVYTIMNWGKTVLETAVSLVGRAAPPQLLQKLTYMAFNHHHQIQRIDTVRAYTFGTFYFVEVDIELPEEMPLKEAHEIGESLQNRLEALPEVERAFVHLDYECLHRPEHSSTVK